MTKRRKVRASASIPWAPYMVKVFAPFDLGAPPPTVRVYRTKARNCVTFVGLFTAEETGVRFTVRARVNLGPDAFPKELL